MARKRDRRFPVNLPIVKEIRLSLWGHTRGVSKTRMAEAILIDKVSNADNWNEVCRDLRPCCCNSQNSRRRVNKRSITIGTVTKNLEN